MNKPRERTAEEWAQVCQDITGGYKPTGGKENVYASGIAWAEWLSENFDLWRDGDTVLDVGCGNGRLAMALVTKDVRRYMGLDVVEPAIEFCKTAFAGEERFEFLHLDVRNGHYWDRGDTPPEKMRLPFPDETFDLVIASSLFSHLGTNAAAERYCAEARRVLKTGGRFFSTWFTSPPLEVSEDEALTVYRFADITVDFLRGFRIEKSLPYDEKRAIGRQAMMLAEKI